MRTPTQDAASQSTASEFKTIKAARGAGYRQMPRGHYGGTQILIKGHLLAKNPVRAKSESEWGREGYKVRDGETPHDWVYAQSYGKSFHYAVYRDDQVTPKRKANKPPPKEVPLTAAVWALNRRAKRARDMAANSYRNGLHGFAGGYRREKSRCYVLKGQALHWLLSDGVLRIAGYHVFDGGNWAQVLEGDGYRFHRPCREEDVPVDVLANPGSHRLGEIDAKPKDAAECRICDAVFTVEQFLSCREQMHCFEWPERRRLAARDERRTDDADPPAELEAEFDELDDDDGFDDFYRDER